MTVSPASNATVSPPAARVPEALPSASRTVSAPTSAAAVIFIVKPSPVWLRTPYFPASSDCSAAPYRTRLPSRGMPPPLKSASGIMDQAR